MRNLKRVLSLSLASIMLLGMMVIGTSAATDYPDVDYVNDNVEAIEVLEAIDVMTGYPEDGTFKPGNEVSRAEMARIMAALMDLDYDYYIGVNPFTDMVGHWAEGYAAACAANGIIAGRTTTTYDPSATVTAVEAAAMLMRALGYFQNWAADYADGFEISTIRQAGKIDLFKLVDVKTNEPMTRNDVAQLILNTLQSGMVEPSENNKVEVTVGDAQVTIGSSNYVYVVSRDLIVGNAINTDTADAGNSVDGLEGPILDLGEKLYGGKLKRYGDTRAPIEEASDIFNRPARTWEYDGKEIGTYMKTENVRETYTQAVTNRTLYDLLGRTALEDYEVNYYVDGVLTPNPNGATDVATAILTRNERNFGSTNRGVLTQVFVDLEKSRIDISSIRTFLAKATMDYSATTESVLLEVYTNHTTSAGVVTTTVATTTVRLADVPGIESILQDDYVRINVSGKNGTNLNLNTLNGYEVAIVEDVEILADSTLTKFSKGDNLDTQSNSNEGFFSSVVSEGSEYKSSARAHYSEDVLDLYDNGLLANHTYNIYLDGYGYALGIDLYSGDDNYVFITGFDTSTSNIALGSAKAAAIFTDGTMGVIDVNVRDTNNNIQKVIDARTATPGTDGRNYFELWRNPMQVGEAYSLNRWYTYSVDASGEYTLNPAIRMFTTEVRDDDTTTADDYIIKCDNVRIDEYAADIADNGAAAGQITGRAYGNDDSVYIVVEAEEIADNSDNKNVISDVTGVYTGVQSVEIEVTGKTSRSSVAGLPADGAIPAVPAGTETYLPDSDGNDTVLFDSIYTLYDRNNYIIASVILGEARGNDANLAYIMTAAKSEERLADGSYIWTFDAIVDGKVVTLETNSKFTKVISDLEPGHIQELRYNGEYVTGVKTPTALDDYWTADKAFGNVKIDKEVIFDIGHQPGGGRTDQGTADYRDCNSTATNRYTNDVQGVGTWGWDTDGNSAASGLGGHTAGTHLTDAEATDVKVVGRTLYLAGNTGADRGLAFVENAPAVILHIVDGSGEYVECGSVAQAVAQLGDANDATTNRKEFAGRIVGVLNSQGVAKWVVFIDDTELTTAPGGNVNPRTARITLTGDVDVGLATAFGPTSLTDVGSVNVPGGNAYTLYLNSGYEARVTGSSGTGGGLFPVLGAANVYTVTAPANGGSITIEIRRIPQTVYYTAGTGTPSFSTVNGELARGNNVEITGEWKPADGSNQTLKLNGQTLTLKGDFNADNTGGGATNIAVSGPGTLDVSGKLVLDDQPGDIDFEIIAGDLDLSVKTEMDIDEDITVMNRMRIYGNAAAHTVTINTGKQVTVGGDLLLGSGNITIDIYGTLSTGNDVEEGGTATFTVNDLRGNSLIVGGTVIDTDLTIGGSSTSGNTTIYAMNGGDLHLQGGTLTITGTQFEPDDVIIEAGVATNGFKVVLEKDLTAQSAAVTKITGNGDSGKGTYDVGRDSKPGADGPVLSGSGTAPVNVSTLTATLEDDTVYQGLKSAAGTANDPTSQDAKDYTKAAMDALRTVSDGKPAVVDGSAGSQEIIDAFNATTTKGTNDIDVTKNGIHICLWYNTSWKASGTLYVAFYDKDGKLVGIEDHEMGREGRGNPEYGWIAQKDASSWDVIVSNGALVTNRGEGTKVLKDGESYTYVVYDMTLTTSTIDTVKSSLNAGTVVYTGTIKMPGTASNTNAAN